MSEIFDRLNRLERILKTKKIIKEKDLLSLKSKELKEYYSFRAFLTVDKRLRPSKVLKEFQKYKKTGLAIKSEDIGYNLRKTKYFQESDKYKSGRGLIDEVTDAIQESGSKLESIKEKFGYVDIRYDVKSLRKLIILSTDNLEWLKNLPEKYYVNIEGTSYNKNGLDFIFDYFNQSNDFSANLAGKVERGEISIYKR